jgi:hypothetical protein
MKCSWMDWAWLVDPEWIDDQNCPDFDSYCDCNKGLCVLNGGPGGLLLMGW